MVDVIRGLAEGTKTVELQDKAERYLKQVKV
jgi:hypothetical protein